MKNIVSYLRYSNVTISFRLNPFTWSWLPYFGLYKDNTWPSNSKSLTFCWLSVRLVVSLDNGSW
jgi:hypothetical protein